MSKDIIYITQTDKTRLVELITRTVREGGRDVAHLRSLGEELERARVVDSSDIPADVVTMNSTVRFSDSESGEQYTYTLAYPESANIDEGRISILSPIGTGLLGYRIGQVIEWPVPGGTRKLRIEQLVYQPEAAGDLHL